MSGTNGIRKANPAKNANGLAEIAEVAPVPAEITAGQQRGRPFIAGKSGNPAGRPRGSRNQITNMVYNFVLGDFEENGQSVLASLRKKDPLSYLKFVQLFVNLEAIQERERIFAPTFADMDDETLLEIFEKIRSDKDIRSKIRVLSEK